MALTGAQLLTGLSSFIEDSWSSTTTSAGNAGGTTLIDTALRRYGDGYLRGRFVRITSGTNDLEIRQITDNTQATGTATVGGAFTAQVASAVTYQIHKYDPVRKFAALDAARIEAADVLFIARVDDTTTADGESTEFAIPTTVRKGPALVFVETPLSQTPSWNLLSGPQGDTLTGWTPVGFTDSIFTGDELDALVPKYSGSCTKLVVPSTTACTYRQVVGDMNSNMTAARAAGRRMTAAMWVYARVAARVDLSFLDDSGAVATSDDHLGRGWQLLKVSGTVVGSNATTLTVSLNVTSGAAMTIFWEGAWFLLGEDLPTFYPQPLSKKVRRDDTTQRMILPYVVTRGLQIRMVGTDVLSALGTTAATQVTNTMEVDANSAELLYAYAALKLYSWEGLAIENDAKLQTRIQLVMLRKAELQSQWSYQLQEQRMEGPYN